MSDKDQPVPTPSPGVAPPNQASKPKSTTTKTPKATVTKTSGPNVSGVVAYYNSLVGKESGPTCLGTIGDAYEHAGIDKVAKTRGWDTAKDFTGAVIKAGNLDKGAPQAGDIAIFRGSSQGHVAYGVGDGYIVTNDVRDSSGVKKWTKLKYTDLQSVWGSSGQYLGRTGYGHEGAKITGVSTVADTPKTKAVQPKTSISRNQSFGTAVTSSTSAPYSASGFTVPSSFSGFAPQPTGPVSPVVRPEKEVF